MSDNQEGLRTKLKIIRAVDRPIDSISVNEICEKAGVSRQTFYNHFNTKQDTINWWVLWVRQTCVDEIGRTYSWEEGYMRNTYLYNCEVDFLNTALKNGVLIPAFCAHPVMVHRKEVLVDTVTNYRNGIVNDELMFCITAFSHLEGEIVTEFCKEGSMQEHLKSAKRILSMVPPLLYDAVQLPEYKHKTQRENYESLEEINERILAEENFASSFFHADL